jgi:hypothetical protein
MDEPIVDVIKGELVSTETHITLTVKPNFRRVVILD